MGNFTDKYLARETLVTAAKAMLLFNKHKRLALHALHCFVKLSNTSQTKWLLDGIRQLAD